MTASAMAHQRTACDRDTRVENFAAELTSAVYPLLLRCGLKDSWLQVELGLWRALAETVEKRTRNSPPAASADKFEAWREALVVELTIRALSLALNSGITASLLDMERGLSRAFRQVIGRYSRVRQSE